MQRYICAHPEFEAVWPFVPERLRQQWPHARFHRFDHDDQRPLGEVVTDTHDVEQLVVVGVEVTERCLDRFPALAEAAIYESGYEHASHLEEALTQRGVTVHHHESEGFWSQSVAECAIGLTISGLRRIPQLHQRIQQDQSPWQYAPEGQPGPGKRGQQFGDDDRFTCGTVAGKRVRIVGVGNIGSRYADFIQTLGGDVGAYDPYADEPCFHRAGADRIHSLSRLVENADIFAPLVPPLEETVGMIDRELINALPTGCLVVLATRARVVDTAALRERVMTDELALAADVWDENPGEPIPLDDPLLGRHNVVHTPHIAGRTRHANEEWADRLVDRFSSA